MATRFRVDVSFDGTGFAGWQVQPGQRTVQGELGDMLKRLGEKELPTGAGRTDAGVHALGMPSHVDLERKWDAGELLQALGSLAPPDIRVLAASPVDPAFHARFDAQSRTYHYALGLTHNPFFRFRMWAPGPLPEADWAARELESLVGKQDYASFGKSGSSQETSLCEIHDATWWRAEGGAVLSITANRFLYGMVRAVVGSLVRQYQRGAAPGVFREILQQGDRAASGEGAPACGLYLAGVSYPGDPIWVSRVEVVSGFAGLAGQASDKGPHDG